MADNIELATQSKTTSLKQKTSSLDLFRPTSLSEAWEFAKILAESGMVPKQYVNKPAAIISTWQFSLELGIGLMQGLQGICNINGTPAAFGDLPLGLVRASGLLESIQEDDFETIKKNQKATCIVKRKGDPIETKVVFSYEDAKTAGIFGNNVWKTYPYRMCMFRARGFALRDKFPDVLKGLKIAEEVGDYIEGEASEQPKPSASIVIPTAETAAPATEVKPETKAVVTKPDVISIDEAKQWYKAYSATGHKPDEAKAWLKETFDITDSRLIPSVQFENAMAWANTPKVEENLDAEPA